jgi:hypothetical protein
MPSLFKRPDSPCWFCSFRGADGRWLKRTTKTTDRRKALEFCVGLDKAAEVARRHELTIAQARKALAEMISISSGEQLTTYTVRSWFDEWLTNKVCFIAKVLS